jgi:hypothetical protein
VTDGSLGYLISLTILLEAKQRVKCESTLAIYRLQENLSITKEETGILQYNIIIEFCTPMESGSLIKLCLNETYSNIHIFKNLLDAFLLRVV